MSDDLFPLIITFGCRLNSYESEVIRRHVKTAGLGEVVVVNTCGVTGEAARQAGQAIRKARREYPKALVIVTGCAAQIAPEKYAAMPEVNAVIPNADKLKEATYFQLKIRSSESVSGAASIAKKSEVVNGVFAPVIDGFEGGLTRGFVPVQFGCNNACTFCVVPGTRGPARSVPLPTIVEQTRLLVVEKGYPEIALTGVDIASYGCDGSRGVTLGAVVRGILDAVPELQRLRLSSLDPAAIDADLWSVIADEPRLMPHLHLSLQAGDDMILKRMKRRHTRQDVIDLVTRARKLRPDMTFGADIIAGFPTETDTMFENTRALVEDLDLTWLHVFPYSARTGTPAAKMPQVKMEVRKARAATLREVGEKAVHRHLSLLVGRRLAVHIEQPYLGRAPSFAEVTFDTPQQVGSVLIAEIVGKEGTRAIGQIKSANENEKEIIND